MELSIDAPGVITAIHDDSLSPFYDEVFNDGGRVRITRASNVEPTEDACWIASMTDGAELGPFFTRAEALAAEVSYLKAKLF